MAKFDFFWLMDLFYKAVKFYRGSCGTVNIDFQIHNRLFLPITLEIQYNFDIHFIKICILCSQPHCVFYTVIFMGDVLKGLYFSYSNCLLHFTG
jgi:hypothetical protein